MEERRRDEAEVPLRVPGLAEEEDRIKDFLLRFFLAPIPSEGEGEGEGMGGGSEDASEGGAEAKVDEGGALMPAAGTPDAVLL